RPRADGRLSRVRAPACTRGRSARHRAQCPRWLAGVRHRGAWAGRGTRHRAAARWTFARPGRPGRRRVRARGWWSAANNGDGVTVRFAERMSRLGTESAFEVLAHARRLEAEGRQVIHLEIGEPDFQAARVRQHLRSEEHTSELQSRENLVCRLLLEKKKT